jgi:hypothetical protein
MNIQVFKILVYLVKSNVYIKETNTIILYQIGLFYSHFTHSFFKIIYYNLFNF